MNDELFFKRIEKIRGRMYAIAYSYFYSESMAVDMVDEAVYKGYLKKKSLKEEAYFETWMIRILMNLCCTHYKKMKRHRSFEEYVVDHEPSASVSTERMEMIDAVSHLPEDYRKVITLKYFGEYTTSEIADMLGIPMGTVGTRVRKALALLRDELGGDET